MPADDLSAPLKAKSGFGSRLFDVARNLGNRLGLGRINPTRAISMLVALLVVAGALYVRFEGQETGGVPIAIVEIAPKSQIEGAMPGQSDLAMRGTQTSDQPEQADDDISETLDTGDSSAKIIIIRPEESIRARPLPPIPDNRLIERAEVGLLPQRAEDGTAPMTVYARPHKFKTVGAEGALPRIAILVNGMGLNTRQTTAAIQDLPAEVSFAFAPYADKLQQWVSDARQNGHEVFLQIPLEPFDFPDNDPGPHTLLSSLTPAENIERLEWLMAQLVGYAGITNFMGARFTASREALRPIMLEIKKRGLFYVDDGTSPRSLVLDIAEDIGSQVTQATVVLDAVPAPDAITTALEQLEVTAYRDGMALGVISALPVSIETIRDWIEHAEDRGIEIIPVTATARADAQG